MSGPEVSAWLAENWPWLAGGALAGVAWTAIAHLIDEVAIERSWRPRYEQSVAQRALRDAATDASERGDVGRPGEIEVWDWLNARAEGLGKQ